MSHGQVPSPRWPVLKNRHYGISVSLADVFLSFSVKSSSGDLYSTFKLVFIDDVRLNKWV